MENWGSAVQIRVIPNAHMWPLTGSMCVWAGWPGGWSDTVVILMGPWITRGGQAQGVPDAPPRQSQTSGHVWDKLDGQSCAGRVRTAPVQQRVVMPPSPLHT